MKEAHWNHRVMRHEKDGEIWYAIHEVHYPEIGKILWTEGDMGIEPAGETVDDLKWTLEHMLAAMGKPIIDYQTGEEIKNDPQG